MRRGLVALLLVMGAACGGEPAPKAPTAEAQFVEFMRENVDGAAAKSDEELIEGGQALCDELEGKSVADLEVIAETLDLDMQDFADALVGSVRTFCPEYNHLID